MATRERIESFFAFEANALRDFVVSVCGSKIEAYASMSGRGGDGIYT